jgi:hypothetical protein
MILNTQKWQETIAAAKAKAEGNAALLRAIDRAVKEIERALYWSFVAGILRIQSTTSKKLYVVDDAHSCDATANGHKFCKHTVARRLMLRYVERLGASEATGETRTVRTWQAVETKRVTVSDAQGVKRIDGQVMRKRAEAVAA